MPFLIEGHANLYLREKYMKVVNLDKFKKKQKVILEDAEYNIYGMKVGEFVEEGMDESKYENMTIKEQVVFFIDSILKHSDIPKEVLLDQEIEVLSALMQVMQGVDPSEKDEDKKK